MADGRVDVTARKQIEVKADSHRKTKALQPAIGPALSAPTSAPTLEPLSEIKSGVNVPTAKPFRQKGKKYMSKRSGQTGQVFLRNNRWVGRFYVDVPGQTNRVRKAVVLGMKNEITKPQAKLKLKTMLSAEGVNTPEHLERSLRPVTVFNAVADLWESKRLLQLKESSKYSVPKLIAKHLRPFFAQLALEEIRTGNVNDWIAEMQSKKLEPKTIHNL